MDEEYAKSCLMKVGLTEYEARIYSALVRMGQKTAGEISFIAKIPRPKTYGSIKSLERKGFLSVIPSKPERYAAASPNSVLHPLIEKLREDVEACSKTLESLALSYESSKYIHMEEQYETKEIWTVRGGENIRKKLVKMMAEAEQSIFTLTNIAGTIKIYNSYADTLEKAAERNVDTRIIAPTTKENEYAIKELKTIVKIKTTNLPLPKYTIKDNSEIIFTETIPDDNTQKETASWTNDPTLIKTHRETYLKLWQTI